MWQLWQTARGPYGELSHLPDGGGVMDQHAPTMAALRELSCAWGWLDKTFPPRTDKQATG